jgi:hypothetical protein
MLNVEGEDVELQVAEHADPGKGVGFQKEIWSIKDIN